MKRLQKITCKGSNETFGCSVILSQMHLQSCWCKTKRRNPEKNQKYLGYLAIAKAVTIAPNIFSANNFCLLSESETITGITWHFRPLKKQLCGSNASQITLQTVQGLENVVLHEGMGTQVRRYHLFKILIYTHHFGMSIKGTRMIVTYLQLVISPFQGRLEWHQQPQPMT